MSSSSSPPPSEAGLGRSTPLVTIPPTGMHGSGIQTHQQQQQQRSSSSLTSATSNSSHTSTTSTTDHPLATVTHPLAHGMDTDVELTLSDRSSSGAAAPAAPASSWNPQQEYQQHQQQQYAASAAPNTFATPTKAPVAPLLPPPPAPKVPFKPKTLDELTDIFLTGPTPDPDTAADTAATTKIMLRPTPLPNVPDLERLRILVERRAWADVLQVAAQLLQPNASSNSPYAPLYTALIHNPTSLTSGGQSLDSHQAELVEILTLQCHAWIKLKKYMELGLQIDRWSFCHHLTGGGNGGKSTTAGPTWIPWSLHILAASSLQYTMAAAVKAPKSGSTDTTATSTSTAADTGLVTAADALCSIRADLPPDLYSERLQVEQALANIFTRQKEWRLALQALQRMMDLLSQHPVCVKELESMASGKSGSKTDIDNDAAVVLESAYKCDLLSRQGHILLQVGAVEQASEIFQQAKLLWSGLVEKGLASQEKLRLLLPYHYEAVQLIPAQLHANEGLFSFACGKYDQAGEFFRSTIQEIESVESSSTAMTCTYRRKDYVGPSLLLATEFRHCLYSETMNNMALCAIYTCRLHEAVHTMERLVRQDPTAYLTERVAYNLCTLYELGSDTTASARKKRVLQIVAKRFFLHDIGPECFRIS
jgi:tetratricopeptide (TPR) repeat protein